jgi:hypothetical protein
MVRLDACLGADDDKALDEVAQLADIAGERIAHQDFHRGVAEFASALTVGGTELVQKIFREDWNVFLAIAERRDEEGNYVQAIKKVLAEGATRDFLFEIFVCGGEYTNVHAGALA